MVVLLSARHGTCNLLLTLSSKAKTMRHSKAILHPTDFSLHSRCAFEVAHSLAREQGAQLTLLHVLSNPGDVAARARAERALAKLMELDLNSCMRSTILTGDAAGNILWMAEEFRFDLIVLAARERVGLGSLVSPGVSRMVVRRAPCPVVRVEVPASWFTEDVDHGVQRSRIPRLRQARNRYSQHVEDCQRISRRERTDLSLFISFSAAEPALLLSFNGWRWARWLVLIP